MTKELEYRSARSAFRHEGVARRLVTEFKFGGQPVLGRVMADLARPAFAEYVESIVPAGELFVTWVPTHQSSKRERGYNQAEILARRLASGPPSLPCAELVTKMAGTRHQKGLSKADRQSNLRGAFSADPMRRSKPTLISGSSEGCMSPAILLVDDVFTTGATATAVSSVLTAETGLPVHIFTFSRAVARVVEGHD
jgi:predicted amidophosphoribosyltransferase